MFGRLAELAVIVWIHEKASVEHYWLFMTWVFYHLLLNSEMLNVRVCVIRRLTDNWYCWTLVYRPCRPNVCPASLRCNLFFPCVLFFQSPLFTVLFDTHSQISHLYATLSWSLSPTPFLSLSISSSIYASGFWGALFDLKGETQWCIRKSEIYYICSRQTLKIQ